MLQQFSRSRQMPVGFWSKSMLSVCLPAATVRLHPLGKRKTAQCNTTNKTIKMYNFFSINSFVHLANECALLKKRPRHNRNRGMVTAAGSIPFR